MSAPPPLPDGASVAATPSRPPRMATWKIVLIVCAALALPVLVIVAILAAIAIPAYQDYTLRARVYTAVAAVAPLKTQIVQFEDEQQACPGNDDEGFGAPESYAGDSGAAVRIGEFDGRCGLELHLDDPSPRLDGKVLRLEHDAESGDWDCSSDIEVRYLPASCRG
ncbi:hypothetical protein CSC70_00815 [Pseudoxanthomonas kalamensis DSM 18571]|nr:hypothetical protein CSC70_00815 [Pseudoxanthomonas kalamensis DSM 18571]